MESLIKQLRAFDDKAKEVGLDARLLRDAADRIEALEAALREIAETFAVGKAVKIARAALAPEQDK